MGKRQIPWWWRGASWQQCQKKTDPPLLSPQTKSLSFWVASVRLLARMKKSNEVIKAVFQS